jgi:crotonobetainyl-CoA:carnitine CoA-transferase CaiB-like acyl-CoA transferase
VNRGKRSIALNVRNEAGLEVFKILLRTANVFFTNSRPGVIESWDCGYEEIKKLNPRIIFCLVSGYGQTGPYTRARAASTL